MAGILCPDNLQVNYPDPGLILELGMQREDKARVLQ